MGKHGGGFHRIVHLSGLFSQGPGAYLGCPDAGAAACPLHRPALPADPAAPPLGGRPRSALGPRWRPAAFHHVTTAAYMRFLHGVTRQART